MERTNSEDGEDLDEPNWEVDPKVELDVDMKESDNTKDDVSQQKHKSKTKLKNMRRSTLAAYSFLL